MSDTQPTTVDDQAQEAIHDEEATPRATSEEHPTEDPHTPEATEDTTGDSGDSDEQRRAAITRANREAAKYRTRLREAEEREQRLRESVAKLLGGDDTEEIDPQERVNQAIAERDAALAEARDLKITTAITRAASTLNADGELVAAYLRGSGKLEGIDPADPEFASQVEEIIKATVKAHPQLSTQVVPHSSGNAPTPADQDGKRRLTDDELSRLAAAGRWDEINKAVAEGRA